MRVVTQSLAFFAIGWSLLAVTMAGCASGSDIKRPPSTADKAQSDKTQSKTVHAHNRSLSQGYAQLYEAASGLQHMNKLLYVKYESDKVEAVIDDIAAYGKQLAGQLQQLAADYPALTIDNTGLPEMEVKKRKAAQWDRIFSLAPVVGQTGKQFERTLLLTQSGALNQLRFLAEVMHDSEKDDNRKAFLADVKQRFDRLYDKIVKLLNENYFC